MLNSPKGVFSGDAFWDEAEMACPGGATFEEAVESFDNYCKYCLGA